jgi:hypothetical protein
MKEMYPYILLQRVNAVFASCTTYEQRQVAKQYARLVEKIILMRYGCDVWYAPQSSAGR